MIPGDPERTRDFAYVDDVVEAVESLVADGRWNETVLLAAGTPTSLLPRRRARPGRRRVRLAAQDPGGELPPGENDSWEAPDGTGLQCVRPLDQAISDYVGWLRTHPAAEGRARA